MIASFMWELELSEHALKYSRTKSFMYNLIAFRLLQKKTATKYIRQLFCFISRLNMNNCASVW